MTILETTKKEKYTSCTSQSTGGGLTKHTGTIFSNAFILTIS